MDDSGLASAADPVAGDRARIFVHTPSGQQLQARAECAGCAILCGRKPCDGRMGEGERKYPSPAVDDLETALVYSPDNFQYRLKLTDALVASGATGEALAQLHAFWEQRPR